jgi:salicylate hydroxylase
LTSKTDFKYIVVGGGIGGLAAALTLADTEQEVCVLEQAEEFSEIGFGLQLAPNALRALDKLGVLEDVKKKAVFPRRLVILDAISGNELTSLDLGNQFRERYGYPYIVTHRVDLHNALLDACKSNPNISLLTNQKVTSIQDIGEIIKVETSEGINYNAEVVIGADGLWSHTRRLVSNDGAVCSKFVAYRGTIPTREISPHEHFDDVVCWIAPSLHLVQYPLRNKELYNQVAVFKSDRYKEGSDDWGTVEELEEHFSKCCDKVQNYVTFIQRHRRWPLYDREPIKNWTKGRFTLLGDAAHPMLQYLAQGACQALEDAIVLGEKIKTFGDNVKKALLAYQEERIPRTKKVQQRARTFGDILHTGDPVAILLRNELFNKRSPFDYEIVDWLYK